MSVDIQNTISKLLQESSRYNSNDVLVNVDVENSRLYKFEGNLSVAIEDFPSKVLRDTNKTKKDSGVNPLCISTGSVELSNNESLKITPIILTPVKYRLDKIKNCIEFEVIEEDTFVNPYLIYHLKTNLSIQIDSSLADSNEVQLWAQYLQSIGLSVVNEEEKFIGNFHHHRYQIIKELEEILSKSTFPNTLTSLFEHDKTSETPVFELTRQNLFPADIDHENVFEELTRNNLVIQGPPGTGKSQVLSNIVGKVLASNKKALFLSEKRAALEVIRKRLSSFGLDKLCFIATSDHLSKSFLQDLKSTWDYFDNYKKTPISNLTISEQLEDNLQMTLDLLNQKDLIGGVSFQQFQALAKNLPNHVTYSSSLPSIPSYLKNKNLVETIYDSNLNQSLSRLKANIINGDEILTLDKKIRSWNETIQELRLSFTLNNWGDLKTLIQNAADCQIFENDLFKKHSNIYKPNSRAQKRFLNIVKKQSKINAGVKLNNSHWKIAPSEIETIDLLKSIESPSWFRKRQLKKRWKQLSSVSFENAKTTLSKHLVDIQKTSSLSQINIDFCELGIENPSIDVGLIRQSLHFYSEEKWDLFHSLNSQERLKITNSHDLLNNLWNDLRLHFNLDIDTNLQSYLDTLEDDLSKIIELHNELKAFNNDALYLMRINKNAEEYQKQLYSGHWIKFKEKFPAFSSFKIEDIQSKIEAIIEAQKTEGNMLSREIEKNVFEKFNYYHELLTIPAHKLKQEEKDLKKRLRKGKSILVKEFSKTRSHPSLRELFGSQAKEWIQLLKPIWLSNPIQLAKCFPLEQQLFDLCIFDEASQIPVQNSVGALYRSKRAAIAGDEHQMGPTSYFSAGKKEDVDLLHQANYYWQSIGLTHHYRSNSPDLIQFSNRNFYQGKLKAYPSHPSTTSLEFHHVENGVFVDRINVVEAKKAAAIISKSLQTSGDVGVVAFSEEQLNCIWSQLDNKDQLKLTENINNNKGFFKAVENVQGDECDDLIVCFGYGKNGAGEFHHRFGPMNSENGRKRLNVLLTRARNSIKFISSVTSSDFKITENESVNLIQKWFRFIENYQPSKDVEIPSEMDSSIKGNKLTLHPNGNSTLIARELVTNYQVLTNRGWKINYA